MPKRAPGMSCVGAILLSGACVTAFAQKDPMDKHGGHPLARRPSTLADLLDQPAWENPPPPPAEAGPGFPAPESVEAGKDAAVPPAAPTPPRPRGELMEPRRGGQRNVPDDLREAIDDRHRLVDRANLFETLERIIREERELAKRAAVLNAAVRSQNHAAEQANMLNHPGATMVSPGAKSAAMQAWRNAQAKTLNARNEWQRQVNVVQPLIESVQPEIGPWMECYWRMRRAVQFDRRDPNRQAVLGILKDAVGSRADFIEGRVLAAILEVFDGNAAGAEDHLKTACKGMARYNLFGTPFANDGCLGYLLLGRPDMVGDFIAAVRKLDAPRQTAFRCWLVGLGGMLQCKDNEAAAYLQKALAKIDFYKKDKEVPAEAAALLGDAALFRLTAHNEAQRDTDKARDILAGTSPDWDVWQVHRARAALAAADGNWPEAIQHIDRCGQACPPSLAEEVAAQREAYEGQELWIRPRLKAKVAVSR